MSSGKFLLGVLAGISAGAVLGILFAPHKGSKTRRKIADKSNAYTDELKEKFNESLNIITSKFECAKADADGKDEFDEADVRA